MTVTRENFHADLDVLEREITRMGWRVRDVVSEAVKALHERDVVRSQSIVDRDDEIDDAEMAIERTCLELLALQQPVASDLRTITAGLRMISDFERMADHAADIAKTTIRLGDQSLVKPLVDIPRMAEITVMMAGRVLDALEARDAEAARVIALEDDAVDHLYNQILQDLLLVMGTDAQAIEQGALLLMVASHLERVADYVTNIAEWVIYRVSGERPELNN